MLLFGKDAKGDENVVILELKQWSNDHVHTSSSEGNVVVDYGRFRREQPHPSLQVEGYYFHLKDFLAIFDEKGAPTLSASTYAHNYSRVDSALLFSDEFKESIRHFPIFAKEDSTELARYLKERLQSGKGQVVFERFARSPLKPSKKLLDHTSEMINKQQIFNLIDDQIAAYNAIMHKAKQLTPC